MWRRCSFTANQTFELSSARDVALAQASLPINMHDHFQRRRKLQVWKYRNININIQQAMFYLLFVEDIKKPIPAHVQTKNSVKLDRDPQ
jgi:hypothetical protein